MKASVYRKYGPPDVLQMCELDRPVPKDDEVLIRVHATTVTSADWRLRSLTMPYGFRLLGRLAMGFSRPRQPVLGTELSGEVVAVGQTVKRFKVGDQVFAFPGTACHAEYRCVRADGPVALKPANLSHRQAAALCFGGATMLDFYRRGALVRGERVLINGASGCVGAAAVQLAKHLGAHVTGVCSTGNVELVRSIGADQVIDYTQQDFARSGESFDVIVDTVGNAPFSRSGPLLRPGGRLLMVLGELPDMLKIPWINLASGKKVVAGPAAMRTEYLSQLAELAAAGKVLPVIDRVYPFDQMVEAHRYVDQGRKRGNVVIDVCVEDGAA